MHYIAALVRERLGVKASAGARYSEVEVWAAKTGRQDKRNEIMEEEGALARKDVCRSPAPEDSAGGVGLYNRPSRQRMRDSHR